MSNYSNSEVSLSNLERKILKNTFSSNSNFLKGLEHPQSQNSLFASINYECSPIPSRSIGSINSTFRGNLFKNSFFEVDLSMALDDSVSIAEKLQEIICSSPPHAKIILPGTKIVLESLEIRESLTLKGSPGSKLCVTAGSIVINANRLDKNLKISIQELEITGENNIPALFYFKSPGIEAEISDCVIKAGIPLKNPCFSLSPLCKLSISSCNISNFAEIVEANDDSSLIVTRSHLHHCSFNALTMRNPKLLQISYCMIEKNGKNAIEILATADSVENSTRRTRSSTYRKESREISIENTDILHNQGCGFLLQGEEFADFSADFKFTHNKIAKNQKEGLALKHIQLKSLKITNNDFNSNALTGIWLQKVHRTCQNSIFSLDFNRSFDSALGYGLYLYSICVDLEQNEIFRNNLGGIMLTGSCSSSIYDITRQVTVIQCSFQSNRQNGVNILDFSNQVLFSQCKIIENSKNGCFFMNSEGKTEGCSSLKNFVEVKNCDISENEEFAATVVRYKCRFIENSLLENKEGTYRMGENSKHLIEFDEPGNDALVAIKKSRACRGSCSIF